VTYLLKKILSESKEYSDSGRPQILSVISGGGMSWLYPTLFTGSSAYLHSVIIPYDRSSWTAFGITSDYPKVDTNTTQILLNKLKSFYYPQDGLTYLVINAALRTNRERKGQDRAIIGIEKDGYVNIDTFTFPKYPLKDMDSDRRFQDVIISDYVWTKLTDPLYLNATQSTALY